MTCAISEASVVLPEPGGPQRIIECSSPRSSAARSTRPGPSRCSWPTISSSERGRMRSARGPGGGPAALAGCSNSSIYSTQGGAAAAPPCTPQRGTVGVVVHTRAQPRGEGGEVVDARDRRDLPAGQIGFARAIGDERDAGGGRGQAVHPRVADDDRVPHAREARGDDAPAVGRGLHLCHLVARDDEIERDRKSVV